MKLILLALLFSALSIVLARAAFSRGLGSPSPQHGSNAELARTPLFLEYAQTKEERERGLSGRASLVPRSGMLLLFATSGFYGIWMKDMQFPLDIIWFDGGKRVIAVEENISPLSYPKVFVPSAPARYVLEVNAGFVAEHRVVVGEILTARGEQK